MICLQLFWAFLQIGLFSIGGGYAAMPLIQAQAVEKHGWLTMTQFADIMTIAEMTPGPIAINAATFTGIQIAGIPGALAATLGCIFPSSIIVTFLAWAYFRYRGMGMVKAVLSGLRPAVVALIAGAGVSMIRLSIFTEGVDVAALVLFAGSLVVLRLLKPSAIKVMLLSGVLYFILSFIG